METVHVVSAGNGNHVVSEWRSSLKGMETPKNCIRFATVCNIVRMEVFPERDGNFIFRFKGVPR